MNNYCWTFDPITLMYSYPFFFCCCLFVASSSSIPIKVTHLSSNIKKKYNKKINQNQMRIKFFFKNKKKNKLKIWEEIKNNQKKKKWIQQVQ